MNKENDYLNRPGMRRGSGDSFNLISETTEAAIPPDMRCPHCGLRAPKNWKICKHCNKEIPGRGNV